MAEKRGFEEKLTELEEIVRQLENGDVRLDEMLELFEKGIGLTKECTKELTDAEQKISILMKKNNGEITEEPFAPMK